VTVLADNTQCNGNNGVKTVFHLYLSCRPNFIFTSSMYPSAIIISPSCSSHMSLTSPNARDMTEVPFHCTLRHTAVLDTVTFTATFCEQVLEHILCETITSGGIREYVPILVILQWAYTSSHKYTSYKWAACVRVSRGTAGEWVRVLCGNQKRLRLDPNYMLSCKYICNYVVTMDKRS